MDKTKVAMRYLLFISLLLSSHCMAQSPKRDTIETFMVLVDTLHYSNYNNQLPTINYFDKTGAIMWAKGFIARELTGDRWNEHFYMAPTTYLDSNKKPLSKSTIVILIF